MKTSNAKNSTIYHIVQIGKNVDFEFNGRNYPKFVVDGFKIETSSFYDFVMQSEPLVTTPSGITQKHFIRQTNDGFEVCKYFTGGRAVSVTSFPYSTQEEAEDELFQQVHDYEFLPDDQRITTYYETYDDAYRDMVDLYAELWGIENHVATSILRKQNIVEKLRRERYEQHIQETKDAETERINSQALHYIDLIEPRKESYDETCQRLKAAIGARVDQKVFHAAVRTIRFRFSDSQKL